MLLGILPKCQFAVFFIFIKLTFIGGLMSFVPRVHLFVSN